MQQRKGEGDSRERDRADAIPRLVVKRVLKWTEMMVIPVEGFPFSYEERQWDGGKR